MNETNDVSMYCSPASSKLSYAVKQVIQDPALISEEYGIKRFKDVNGNVISYCQREAMFRAYYSIAKNKFKCDLETLIVGGPRNEFIGDNIYCLNVVGTTDFKNYNGVGIEAKNESFHIIESTHSLEHLKDAVGSIGEFVRVLKKGGFLLIIVPDVTYHRHDMSNHKVGDRCYNEWTPERCLKLFSNYTENGILDLLQFNTRDNKLDFEMCFIKKV